MQTLQQLQSIYSLLKTSQTNIHKPTPKELAIFIKYSALELQNKNLTHEEQLIMYYLDHLFAISKFFAK